MPDSDETLAQITAVVEREYVAFRLEHARLGTVDSPAGFAARFAPQVAEALAPVVAARVKQARVGVLRETSNDVLRGAPVGNEVYSARQVADYLAARARIEHRKDAQ